MLNYSKIFDEAGMDYESYRNLIDGLLAAGKTTGPDQSLSMVHYSKMNVQRMSRLDKTVQLNGDLLSALAALDGKFKLLIITEGWCGDAAQIVPVINKMVAASPDKLSMRFVLRDEQEELMDAHLTNGGRAIPVVLVLDAENGGLIAKWGPRPFVLQNLLADWRKTLEDYELVAEHLHSWYAKDKTQTTQSELAALLRGLEIGN